MNLQGSALSLNGGGTDSGTFNLTAPAALTFGGGTHNLTNATTATAITGSGDVYFAGGTITIAGSVTANSLTSQSYYGSTAILNGAVTVPTVNVTNGLYYNSDALYLNGAVSPIITLNVTGGTLGGTAAVTAATMNWTGGTVTGSGALTVTTALNLNAPVLGTHYLYLDGKTLNNNGAAVQGAGNTFGLFDLHMRNGAVINNALGATWDLNNANIYDDSNGGFGPTAFNNAGTFTNPVGSGGNITVLFNNTGTFSLGSGTVGSLVNASGALLDITGITQAGNVTNDGTIQIINGGVGTITGDVINNSLISVNGTANFDRTLTNNSGATVDLSGTMTVTLGTTNSGAMNITSGSVTGAGGVTVTTLNMAGGTLGVTGAVSADTMNWTGGTVGGSGTLDVNTALNMGLPVAGTYALTLDGKTLNNHGTAVLGTGTVPSTCTCRMARWSTMRWVRPGA